MAESHIVSGLVAKRSELTGQLVAFKRQMATLEANISHLDAIIKLFSPEFDLRTVKAKQPRKRNHCLAHGEGQRLILDALREAGGNARLSEMVAVIGQWKGLGDAEMATIEHSLDAVIRRLERSGVIERVSRDSRGILWQLKPLQDQ